MAEQQIPSFMSALCMGAIEEDLLVPYPQMDAGERDLLATIFTSLEQMLGERTEEFRKWDKEGDLPPEFIEELKQFGAFGLIIPEAYGGLELGSMAYSRVMQELATYDASAAITVGAHSSIGMRGLVLFGTEEQKKRWMPKLATGEMIAAFALTEPGAGSDAAGIQTRAERDGNEWVLSGNKLWITNGGIADFFTVFAKTGEKSITAFIITRDLEGVSTGPHEDKMGLRASSTTTVHLDKVRVSDDYVLGEVGKGFKVAMNILNNGRTGLGGGCVGAMRHLIALAAEQATGRKQFGRPISEFGLIKQKLGTMMVDCYASESVVNLVAGWVDHGVEDYAVEAAISKVYATEALWRTADEALQISGGNGFMKEYPYERIVRDSRINRIFEGTNEILRLFIALTAMNDVGRQLSDLADSLKDVFQHPIKGFGVFSDYFRKQLSLTSGIGSPSFTKLHAAVEADAKTFEAMTRSLAAAVDRILRKHGRNIIGKQFATSRLANIMIELFVLAAVLSRVSAAVEADGEEKAKQQLTILKTLSARTHRNVEHTLMQIDDNEDEYIKELSDFVCETKRYPWDSV